MSTLSSHSSHRDDSQIMQTLWVTIVGSGAFIPGRHHNLEALFRNVAKVPMYCDAKHQLVWKTKRTNFFKRTNNGLIIAEGSLPRVIPALQAGGYRVTIHDTRPDWRQLPISCPRCSPTNACNIAHVLGQYYSAVITAPNNRERQRYIIEVVQQLFDSRILIVVATRAEKERWLAVLSPVMAGKIEGLTPQHTSPSCRVCVATIETSNLTALDIADVILVPAAESVQHERYLQFRQPFIQHWRNFAFDLATDRYDEKESLWLELLCGPRIFVGASRLKPQVYLIPLETTGADQRIADPTGDAALALKRADIWHNSQRNTQVATLARQLVMLPTLSTAIEHSALRQSMQGTVRCTGRVGILVESPEHARQLAIELPDWRVLDRFAIERPIPATTLAEAMAHQLNGKLILTYAALDATRQRLVDVLIRADGGSGSIESRYAASPTIVVDLVDTGSRWLVAQAEKRRRAYDAHEWTLHDGDAIGHRVRSPGTSNA